MTSDLYTNLLNGLLGVLIGCYGTLVGAGGGFLLVPLFLLFHQLPHEVAVGTSLAVVAANAVSGAGTYIFQRKIDYRAGFTFALATIPGAIGGALLTKYFTGPVFMRVFGLFMIGISLYLLLRKPPGEERPSHPGSWGRVDRTLTLPDGTVEKYSYNEPLGLGLSVVVGKFSSLLGIGGGILHVPVMTEVLRFPIHIAVATSHFILAWTALAGATVHAWQGQWNPRLAISTGIGAILGAQGGALLSSRVQGGMLLRLLSLALLLVGLRLLWG